MGILVLHKAFKGRKNSKIILKWRKIGIFGHEWS